MPGSLGEGAVVCGRYRLQEQIGQGGFGSVFRATDLTGTQPGPLAAKVLSAAGRDSAHLRRRFSSEARLLLEIDHPHVVRALDFIDDEQDLVLVMEYLPGRPLTEILARRSRDGNPFTDLELRTVFGQLAAGVAGAHAAGAVHRDLKPANVMLVPDRHGAVQVKILDFGIAKIMAAGSGDQTTVGRMVGSYLYMSPEQALGAAVDARADIFALGTVLFEMATMRRAWARGPDGGHLPLHQPFRLDSDNAIVRILERIVRGERPRPSLIRPELPIAIDAVIERAMAARPEDRTATVEAFTAEVEAAFASAEDAAPTQIQPRDLFASVDLTPLLEAPSEADIWSPLGSWEAPAELEVPPSDDEQHALEASVAGLRSELWKTRSPPPAGAVRRASLDNPHPSSAPSDPLPASASVPPWTPIETPSPGRARWRQALFAAMLLALGALSGAAAQAWLRPTRARVAEEPSRAAAAPAPPAVEVTPARDRAPRATSALEAPPPPSGSPDPAGSSGSPRQEAGPALAPAPAPAPQPAGPAPRPTARPRSTELQTLRRRVAALGQPPEAGAFAELAELVLAQAQIEGPEIRRRVARLVFNARSAGDPQGLREAIATLIEARQVSGRR